jgi:porphobilinogen deaminase
MGKVRKLFNNLINTVSTYIDKETANSDLSLLENVTSSNASDFIYEMPRGRPRTEDELIEDNKKIISDLDSKTLFVLSLVDEMYDDEVDSLDHFAKDSMAMKLWFAHYFYKTRIDEFYNLIKENTNNRYDLPANPKKKIKCITDLPLQKKLLN